MYYNGPFTKLTDPPGAQFASSRRRQVLERNSVTRDAREVVVPDPLSRCFASLNTYAAVCP